LVEEKDFYAKVYECHCKFPSFKDSQEEKRQFLTDDFIGKCINRWKIVHLIERKFFDDKLVHRQYALKLESFSLEALVWILFSMK